MRRRSGEGTVKLRGERAQPHMKTDTTQSHIMWAHADHSGSRHLGHGARPRRPRRWYGTEIGIMRY